MQTLFKKISSVLVLIGLLASSIFYFNVPIEATDEVVHSEPELIPYESVDFSQEKLVLTDGWKFHLGDDVVNAQFPFTSDSDWRSIQLPHDFSAELPYDLRRGEAESAYKLGGSAWYRKNIFVPSTEEGRKQFLYIDGAYNNASIYINGNLLGKHPYGYSPFVFDLSPYISYGSNNLIAIKIEHNYPSSRWYSGSGLFRTVSILNKGSVHTQPLGLTITNDDFNPNQVGSVRTHVKASVHNTKSTSVPVTAMVNVYAANGSLLTSSADTTIDFEANQSKDIALDVSVTPELWDLDHPNLYKFELILKQGEDILDKTTSTYGYRKISFDRNRGFSLNGQFMKLQGVSMHHDQGMLGARAYRDAIARQLDILKEMGVNAIRVTHNPAADALIDLANEKGMLLIEEFYDTWFLPKNGNRNDNARTFTSPIGSDNHIYGKRSDDMTWAEFDVRMTVRRGRNAPSIIAWSMGNELREGISGGNDRQYEDMATRMATWVKEEDPTRLATFGDNKYKANWITPRTMANNIAAVSIGGMGLAGANYMSGSGFDNMYGWSNKWFIYASESSSAVNSRGVYRYIYQNDAALAGHPERNPNTSASQTADKNLTSYDTSRVGWGHTSAQAWKMIIERDFVAGEFVWTGFDYLGEPTPWNGIGAGAVSGSSSPRSSYFGIVDIAGLPKDRYYFYRSQWNHKDTTLHVLPAWKDGEVKKDSEGNVRVDVYSNAKKVKLFFKASESSEWTLVGEKSFTTFRSKSTPGGNQDGIYTYQKYTGADKNTKDDAENFYLSFKVPYADGTLKAEAYDENDQKIENTVGRSEVSTYGNPAVITLDSNKTEVKADGQSLIYLTATIKDAEGKVVENADVPLTVSVNGTGLVFEAMDNGHQTEKEPFTEKTRNTFKGKAVIVLRSTDINGSVQVEVTSPGLEAASVQLTSTGAVEKNTITAYEMVKNYYLKIHGTLQTEDTVKVHRTDNSVETDSITWNNLDEVNSSVAGDYVLKGHTTRTNIPVSANVKVIEQIAGLLNASVAVSLGASSVDLPPARTAYLSNGSLTEMQVPVTWDTSNVDLQTEGVYFVSGTGTLLGNTYPVQGRVRVTQGSLVESGNVLRGADVIQDIPEALKSDNLRALVDGNRNGDRWTNYDNAQAGDLDAEVTFTLTTNTNANKIVVDWFTDTWSADLPETVRFYASTNDNDFVLIENVEESRNGNTITYTFPNREILRLKMYVKAKEGIRKSTATQNIAYCVGAYEVRLLQDTYQLQANTQILPVDATLNGAALREDNLTAEHAVEESLAVVQSESNVENVAITRTPVFENKQYIYFENEAHTRLVKMPVLLNQSGSALAADDPKRDLDPESVTGNVASFQRGHEVGSATDNNLNTQWESGWNENLNENNGAKRYLELVLDEPTRVEAVRYHKRLSNGSVGSNNGSIRQYSIQYKANENDAEFTEIARGNWDVNINAWQQATFAPVVAKVVRLVGLQTVGDANRDGNFMAVAEIRLRKTKDSATDLSSAEDIHVTLENLQESSVDGVEGKVELVSGQSSVRPHVIVYNGQTLLTENTDYLLDYQNNYTVGVGEVSIVGIGDYTGVLTKRFEIYREENPNFQLVHDETLQENEHLSVSIMNAQNQNVIEAYHAKILKIYKVNSLNEGVRQKIEALGLSNLNYERSIYREVKLVDQNNNVIQPENGHRFILRLPLSSGLLAYAKNNKLKVVHIHGAEEEVNLVPFTFDELNQQIELSLTSFSTLAVLAEDESFAETNEAYKLYPIPQSIQYRSTTADMHNKKIYISSDADPAVRARVQEAFAGLSFTITSNLEEADIILSTQNDVAAKNKIQSQVRISKGDLFSKIDSSVTDLKDGKLNILAKDNDALFYALTTLRQMNLQTPSGNWKEFHMEDYADITTRGYIEGYYGNPWSLEDRIRLMEWGGNYKLNAYIYAPKNDPKHNSHWRQLYTPEELETLIKPLAEAGNRSKNYFVYALHTYMHNPIRYNSEANYQADMNILKAKFRQVIDAGVRQIAVLADDAGRPQNYQQNYVRTMRDLTTWIDDEIRPLYPDMKRTIIFVTQEYMYNGEAYYSTFPENVQLVMTGGRVWGTVNQSFINTFYNRTHRNVLLWINWPCSDNAKSRLIMGGNADFLHPKVDGSKVDGIILNPMQQSEPSKVAIFANAVYSWKVWQSAEVADQTWNDSFSFVENNSPVESAASKALREMSKHMINQGMDGRVVKLEESIALKPILDTFKSAMNNDTVDAEKIAQVRTEFETIKTATETYLSEAHDQALKTQVTQHVLSMKDVADTALDYLDAYAAHLQGNSSDFMKKFVSGKQHYEDSKTHTYWYIDHNEHAYVGGEHIHPFLALLKGKLDEFADELVFGPKNKVRIITDVFDQPDSGHIEDVLDGKTSTYIRYTNPVDIPANKHFGLLYEEPIPVNRILIRMEGGKNHFWHSKLQYTEDGVNWIDVNGEVYDRLENDSRPIEVNGLNLHARGVRLITTAPNDKDAWVTFQDFLLNPDINTTQVRPLPNTQFISGSQDNVLDRDTNNYLGVRHQNQDRILPNDGFEVVYDKPVDVASIHLQQGVGAGNDVPDRLKVVIIDENDEPHEIGSYDKTGQLDINLPTVLKAKRIQFINLSSKEVWWRVGNFSIDSVLTQRSNVVLHGIKIASHPSINNNARNNKTEYIIDGINGTSAWMSRASDNGNVPADGAIEVLYTLPVTMDAIHFLQDSGDKAINIDFQLKLEDGSYQTVKSITNASNNVEFNFEARKVKGIKIINKTNLGTWWRVYDVVPHTIVERNTGNLYSSQGNEVPRQVDDGLTYEITPGELLVKAGEFLAVDLGDISFVQAIHSDFDAPAGVQFVATKNNYVFEDVSSNTDRAHRVGFRNTTAQDLTVNIRNLQVQKMQIGTYGELLRSDLPVVSSWGDSRTNGRAMDGKPSTSSKFGGSPVAGNTALYDLGRVLDLNSLRLYANADTEDYPRDLVVETSLDGETWTEAFTVGDGVADTDASNTYETVGAQADTNTPNVRFVGNDQLSIKARYVRLRVTADFPGRAMIINEILVNHGIYTTRTKEPRSTASLEREGSLPEYAFDRHLGTSYVSEENNGNFLWDSLHQGASSLKFVQNTVSGASASVTYVKDGVVKTAVLGILNDSINTFALPENDVVLDVRVAWNGTALNLAEIVFGNEQVALDFSKLDALVDENLEGQVKYEKATEEEKAAYDSLKERIRALNRGEMTQEEIDRYVSELEAARAALSGTEGSASEPSLPTPTVGDTSSMDFYDLSGGQATAQPNRQESTEQENENPVIDKQTSPSTQSPVSNTDNTSKGVSEKSEDASLAKTVKLVSDLEEVADLKVELIDVLTLENISEKAEGWTLHLNTVLGHWSSKEVVKDKLSEEVLHLLADLNEEGYSEGKLYSFTLLDEQDRKVDLPRGTALVVTLPMNLKENVEEAKMVAIVTEASGMKFYNLESLYNVQDKALKVQVEKADYLFLSTKSIASKGEISNEVVPEKDVPINTTSQQSSMTMVVLLGLLSLAVLIVAALVYAVAKGSKR